jgi:hypothetical protein
MVFNVLQKEHEASRVVQLNVLWWGAKFETQTFSLRESGPTTGIPFRTE